MRRWRRALASRLHTVLLALTAGGMASSVEVAHAAVSPGEQAAWDRARSSGAASAFQRYLELYPTGQYAEDAFRILVEKTWRDPARNDPAQSALAPADASEPSSAQVAVAAQSLY